MRLPSLEEASLSGAKNAPRDFRLGVAAVAVAIGCALGVAVAEGAARVVAPHWREYASTRFMTQETGPDGGTLAVGRPGFDGYFAQNDGDFRIRIRLNDAGLRNDESVVAANGRIWAVGDSFTFGWGVAADEMYSAVLGRVLGQPVYNVAAPGGDVTSYRRLIARTPKGVAPRFVVVGLTIENDLSDYESRAAAAPARYSGSQRLSFKEWGIENSALYNLFAVAVKKSEFLQGLFVKAGIIAPAHGLREAPGARTRQALIESTTEELVRFRALFSPQIPIVVLIIPARFEFFAGGAEWVGLRHAMVAALSARGIPTVDPAAALAEAGFAATHFPHDGHWSRRGHEIAGRALAARVAEHVPAARSGAQ